MSGRRLPALALAAVVAVSAGVCDTTLARPATAAHPSPPRRVSARPLVPGAAGGLRRGTRLPSAGLGARVFADPTHGFALTAPTRRGARIYPAASTDGGRTWRVAGPILQLGSGRGAAAVSEPGMIAARSFYAWAPGNPVIDITVDGGRRWWHTAMPDVVLSLNPDRGPRGFANGLDAIVEGPAASADGAGALLWEYRTTDGRHWRFVTDLSAIA
jgi:hypothetical protein